MNVERIHSADHALRAIRRAVGMPGTRTQKLDRIEALVKKAREFKDPQPMPDMEALREEGERLKAIGRADQEEAPEAPPIATPPRSRRARGHNRMEHGGEDRGEAE